MTQHEVLPEHIVVLVHGNNGAPADFDHVARKLMQKYEPDEMLVVQSQVNHTNTHMGVDVGGTKLAQEIVETLMAFPRDPDVAVYRLSVVAHSLGGLYARFAMVLVQTELELAQINVEYVSFITLCTPHLGSRRPHVPSPLAFKSMWRFAVHNTLSSKIYGKTGTDLLVTTDDEGTSSRGKVPVLQAMSEPGSPFFEALRKFSFCTLVGMVNGDVIVPFASATIRNVNPYPEIPLTRKYSQWRWSIRHSGFQDAPMHMQTLLDDHVDHLNVVQDEDAGLKAATSTRYASIDGYDCDNRQDVEFKFEMLRHLQAAVNWRRISILVEPLGIAGKLRLHDWPINKQQAPNCKANEFINLLCDVIGIDHGLPRRDTPLTPPQVDAFGDLLTRQASSGSSSEGSDRSIGTPPSYNTIRGSNAPPWRPNLFGLLN